MKVEMSRLSKVFGDRILVRKLMRPESVKGIYIPASYAKANVKQQSVWFGVIEKFGLDSRYGDAYGLKEGDTIGISDIGTSNASFEGDDGHEHFWVMEEFVVFLDAGRVAAFMRDEKFEGLGISPVGPYALIRPYPEQEKKGGVIIPQGDNPQLTGVVLAVSAGAVVGGELVQLRATVNSDVLFGKFSGLSARFGTDEYLLAKEEDLIAEMAPAQELAHA